MKTSEKYPSPYPQSIEDSHALLTEQNPLQLKINQLQEQLYKERERHLIEQEDLIRLKSHNEALIRDLREAQRLLSKIFRQLNDAGFVVPF